MLNCYCRHPYGRRCLCLTSLFFIALLSTAFHSDFLSFLTGQPMEINNVQYYFPVTIKSLNSSEFSHIYSYENSTQSNRSLCSIQSDHRGPNQKVIGISVYGSSSNYTDNAMYAWESSIVPFLIPLANEVKTLLPSWIIRLYIDFTGSTKSQQEFLYNFS
ncbi:unnamed protein product, partial [Rotaria sp. Silwood2]